MSNVSGCWYFLNGNESQLVHVNAEGLCLVSQPSAAIEAIYVRLERGDDPTSIPEFGMRLPWASVLWLEQSAPLQVSWKYELAGHPAYVFKFAGSSASDCEQLIDAAARFTGMRRTTRQQTGFEMAMEPLLISGGGVLAGGLLFSQLGEVGSVGGGRNAGMKALFRTVANAIGPYGIIGVTLLAVVAGAVLLSRRMRNPPIVHRLER